MKGDFPSSNYAQIGDSQQKFRFLDLIRDLVCDLSAAITVFSIMSLCTLPIMFFNLGGEMLYILDQRLRSQKVGKAKSAKGIIQQSFRYLCSYMCRHGVPYLTTPVMRDIVGQMLDPRCVKEIFRPQKVLTKKSLRTVFDRLAHASIMKLNSSAMEKVCVVSTCVNLSISSSYLDMAIVI